MTLLLEPNENQILLAARIVREHYYPNLEKPLPDWILIFAVRDLLRSWPETSPEDLFDLLVTQSKIKTQGHLSRYLAATITGDLRTWHVREPNAEVSIFTGARRFSFEKISAMAAYLTFYGKGMCRARLNKLLFYCDFVNYFLYGYSISGAKYIRRGLGPELQQFDSTLKTLVYTGVVQVKEGSPNKAEIVVRDETITDKLTILETVTMHWVLSNLGSMTAVEIDLYSQSESAYRFTRQEDLIAYEYARLLQRLPEKSML